MAAPVSAFVSAEYERNESETEIISRDSSLFISELWPPCAYIHV